MRTLFQLSGGNGSSWLWRQTMSQGVCSVKANAPDSFVIVLLFFFLFFFHCGVNNLFCNVAGHFFVVRVFHGEGASA